MTMTATERNFPVTGSDIIEAGHRHIDALGDFTWCRLVPIDPNDWRAEFVRIRTEHPDLPFAVQVEQADKNLKARTTSGSVYENDMVVERHTNRPSSTRVRYRFSMNGGLIFHVGRGNDIDGEWGCHS